MKIKHYELTRQQCNALGIPQCEWNPPERFNWPIHRHKRIMVDAERELRKRIRKNKAAARQRARRAQRSGVERQRANNTQIIARNEREQTVRQAPQTDARTSQSRSAETRRFNALKQIGIYNHGPK